MHRLLIGALVILLTTVAARSAEKTDVQTLRGWCKSPARTDNFTRCLMYIVGVSDMLGMVGSSGKLPTLGTCGDFSYGAAVQAFINWADGHLEAWNQPMGVGAAVALHTKWPCSR